MQLGPPWASLLGAEQAQLPQPLLAAPSGLAHMCPCFTYTEEPRNGSSTLDVSHQHRVEGKDHLSWPAGNTLPYSTQSAVGLNCCKDTVLAHVQFFDPRIPRSSSAKLFSSQHTPSLHYDRVISLQLLSICLYWILWGLCHSMSLGCWDQSEISSNSLLTTEFSP